MAFGDTAVLTAAASGSEVAISVSETGMTSLRVYRVLSGSGEFVVRGANDVPVTGPGLWVGVDYEAPPDKTLYYGAEIYDGATYFTIPPVAATGMADYDGDWIMPVGNPLLGMNIAVERNGVGDLVRDIIRDLQPVLNRNSPVAISYGRRLFSGTITFITLEDGDREQLLSILDFPVLMLMFRTDYGFDQPLYVAVGNAIESRTSGVGYETSRRWFLDLNRVDRPPPDFPYSVVGQSWQAVFDTGDDWTDVEAGYSTMYDLAGYP